MVIYFDEDTAPDKLTQDTMDKAATLCAMHEELDPMRLTLSVTFVDKDEIHRLNKQYRNVDRPTDVLSFPQFDSYAYMESWMEVPLGDVVICSDKAREQAEEFGHSYERELIYLFVHSVFHLLGYDHETEEEKAEMRAAEESVMNKLGIVRA